MKTLYRIVLLINVVLLIVLLVKASEIFVGNWSAYHTPSVEMPRESKVYENEPVKRTSAQEETVSCDTSCRIIECNTLEGKQKEYVCDIPTSYMGKTRTQLISLVELYNQNPPLEEQGKGFLSMELVSFSRDEIVLKKNYEKDVFYGCIVALDDYLAVYDEKRQDIILYTDILLSDLPEDLRMQVIDGKYVKTERELYDFLESYSS